MNGDMMKKRIFLFSMLFVFIDQIIKYLISSNVSLHESINVIPNFLYITHVNNDGAAFSMLSGGRWLFVAIGVISLILLIRFILLDTKISKFDCLSYSLVLSGIVGNLIDRVVYGFVIDYIDFNVFGYDMAIFNFADMCIVVGVLMIIFILIIKGDSDEIVYSRK